MSSKTGSRPQSRSTLSAPAASWHRPWKTPVHPPWLLVSKQQSLPKASSRSGMEHCWCHSGVEVLASICNKLPNVRKMYLALG